MWQLFGCPLRCACVGQAAFSPGSRAPTTPFPPQIPPPTHAATTPTYTPEPNGARCVPRSSRRRLQRALALIKGHTSAEHHCRARLACCAPSSTRDHGPASVSQLPSAWRAPARRALRGSRAPLPATCLPVASPPPLLPPSEPPILHRRLSRWTRTCQGLHRHHHHLPRRPQGPSAHKNSAHTPLWPERAQPPH